MVRRRRWREMGREGREEEGDRGMKKWEIERGGNEERGEEGGRGVGEGKSKQNPSEINKTTHGWCFPVHGMEGKWTQS